MAEMAPPWVTHARKLAALFEHDEDVTVTYDDDPPTVRMWVRGGDKADALASSLLGEVRFGDVALSVIVIPDDGYQSPTDVMRRAFAGNPVVADVSSEGAGPMEGRCHVQFEPVVAQFPDDNLQSPFLITSMLYEDIARDVMRADGVSFSTLPEDL